MEEPISTDELNKFQRPSRDEYIEMVTDARKATAEALAEAIRAGSNFLVERYRDELAGWDALIERVRGR